MNNNRRGMEALVGRCAVTVTAALLTGAMGCSAFKKELPPEPPPLAVPVTVKTVPPRTPTPEGEAVPLKTRPVRNPEAEKAKAAGKLIGPVVTWAGVARADGYPTEPVSVDKKGIPTFVNYVGSGFMIVVEGKPGISNLEVGGSIFRYDPDDPSARPDLQIEVDRPLGDGSARVCDARRPVFGGIPAISPPSFAETEKISAALNDFACRFEKFRKSDESCTLNKYGDFSFVEPEESTMQFCMVVAKAWNFSRGSTLVSVRLRDREENPGPISQFRLSRTQRPTPAKVKRTKTPTPARRRP